jgi:uncharacterized protein YjiS (DUF1127 family)
MPANGHRHPAILRHAWRAISRTPKTFAEGVAEAARRMARAYDELAAMSDPELRDSSINRSDIPAVVSGTYRRTPPPPISDPTSRGRRERSPSPERRDQRATKECLHDKPDLGRTGRSSLHDIHLPRRHRAWDFLRDG